MATAKRVLVLFIVLQSCDLFRERSFLQPAHERGLHWRGGLLRMTKVAIRAARAPGRARGPNQGYALTRKVASRRRYAAACSSPR